MGYLLGAYSKQMAGKRVRSLQARMVRVQSQLRRATRDIEMREKFWARVEKNTKNQIQAQASAMTLAFSQNLQGNVWQNIEGLSTEQRDRLAKGDNKVWSEINGNLGATIAQQLQAANNQNAQITQALQASMQQTLALQEQEIEMQKEAELQPLKDLEDELQTEKDSLESQIQLAQQDYEACKEMEKAGAKNLAPNYTGQS